MPEESKQKEEKAAEIQANAAIEASKIQANAARTTSTIQALALILVTIIGVVAANVEWKSNSSISEIIASPTLTFTSTPNFTPTPTFTLTPYICPFQGQTDDETISNLIRAEADASNSKGLLTILKIFSPNAVFYDYAPKSPKQWNGPQARYEVDLFQTTEFQGVEHFDIMPIGPGIEGDTAYYTSGSKGSYRIVGGAWTNFFNGSLISTRPTQYGSEHWILKKNNNRCWVIVQMDFNAGHIKFP
jgi:hypothetical protein